MSEIEKRSQLTPVPFDNGLLRITKGQQNLLKMLTTHLKENKPIMKDDIVSCYIESIHPNKVRNTTEWYWCKEENMTRGRFVEKQLTVNDWETRSLAMLWFKTNLGSCILKGKLLVIPVINTNQ